MKIKTVLVRAAMLLALFSCLRTNIVAQTRIAVVSDIHVMAPSLLANKAETGVAWTADYASERKMLVESAGLFDQLVTTLTGMAEKPSVLLISGDLTKDGEQASHNYVKTGLQTLEAAGIQVYVIPGNHDITTGTVYKYDGNDKTELTEEEKMTSPDAFSSFYDGYGYGTGSTADPNGSLSYVAEPVEGLVLLAIDSHTASVSESTRTWLCTKALEARAHGKRVIAMMHHPLFPHIEGANMFISTYTVNDYETMRNALINAGVNVILTGHFHTSDIAYDWNDNQANGIYDINTGSLISYPCDYRMLTLSADKSTLDVTTASLTPEGWTAEKCKTWLQGRVKSIATKKMNDKAGNMATMLADYINNIAEFAADLFILHAEGNENASEDRDGLKTTYNNYKSDIRYKMVLNYGGITDASIYSILDDKSNYGGEHENQTNDRTLSVTLTDPSDLSIANNADNSDVIDLYNGVQANVTLSGRTLYKDGAWNTLCLPFNVTLTGSPLEGADVRKLDNANLTDGTLTLNFTAENGITQLEAGTPYIIKWASGDNIVNPVFNNVTIDKTDRSFTSGAGDSQVRFVGTYKNTTFDSEDKSILLLGGENSLYYPQNGASIGACRAYFKIGEDGVMLARGITSFDINYGDGTTSISEERRVKSEEFATAEGWFTLDGRKLSGKPTRKGLYIVNGKKVVIK